MFRFAFIIAAVVAFSSCYPAKTGSTADLNGDWTLSAFPASNRNFSEIFVQRIPTLNFKTAEQRASGNTGCNSYSGTFTSNGNDLKFNNDMISTKMGCTNYDETIYTRALLDVSSFSVSDRKLELLNNGKITMVFSRNP